MDKRSLLAVTLSSLVILVYYTYFFKLPEASAPLPSATISSESKPSVDTTTSGVSNTSISFSNSNNSKDSFLIDPDYKNQTTLLQNGLVEADFESLGGKFKSFILKKFHQSPEKNSPLVNLFSDKLENLQLIFRESNFSLPTNIPFQLLESSPTQLVYEWKGPDFILQKTIELEKENYVAHIRFSLQNLSTQTLRGSPTLRLDTLQNEVHKDSFTFLKGPGNLKFPIQYKDKVTARYRDLTKLGSEKSEKGDFQWVGIEERYYLWAIIARSLSSENQIRYGISSNLLFTELSYPTEVIVPDAKIEKAFSVYLGPKDVELLKSLNVDLEEAVDYGWFGIVAKPILWLLKFFHSWVGNWGLAIIVLTIFIKLLLHPINKKSLESMKGLQKIQPKLKALQEKFANDKERLNTEMMNLFKTHKVNPMGGCLPMLLQMPIYIALYKVLYNAIELYHAPFFAFYKDLSAPDPYFVSPILLGIFMMLQQRLTPSPSQDPNQAKLMMIMPLMFSVFMLFLPAGLVIYIFINTSVTVAQQYLHQKDMSMMDIIQRFRKES
ncbi:MAG: membrane protein insertase YidC [Deltaproteobacteria bacterium]|nr:membrane protein insertase YidC [Deltaproteobacteria bacterium]